MKKEFKELIRYMGIFILGIFLFVILILNAQEAVNELARMYASK